MLLTTYMETYRNKQKQKRLSTIIFRGFVTPVQSLTVNSLPSNHFKGLGSAYFSKQTRL